MLRNHLTITDVAERLGLNPWTLRRLETLGRIPRARRDPLCGRRIYTERDIENLRNALEQVATTYPSA